MLVHSCLFVLLSLLPLIVYISTVLFEQLNDDDDDDIYVQYLLQYRLESL